MAKAQKNTLEIYIIGEQGKNTLPRSSECEAEQHITYTAPGLQSYNKIKVQSKHRSLGTFSFCGYQVDCVLAVARISIRGTTGVLDCIT